MAKFETQKFASGAWVFWTGGATPQDPEDVKSIALACGVDEGIVPEYAGDRACVARVFQSLASQISRKGWLLRPITRSATHVSFAIASEQKNESEQKWNGQQVSQCEWRESEAGTISGDHAVAKLADAKYKSLRGKIVGPDWTLQITDYILNHCNGSPVRDDGRVYWVPPQSLPELAQLADFLSNIGISIVAAEIETKDQVVVKQVAGESLADKLAELKAECEGWDGTQKPSTYTKRIEEYTNLRKRATLYKESLGIAVDEVQSILTNLEEHAQNLFEIRSSIVRKRDGTTVAK